MRHDFDLKYVTLDTSSVILSYMSIIWSLLSWCDLSVYYFVKRTNKTNNHKEIMAMHLNLAE